LRRRRALVRSLVPAGCLLVAALTVVALQPSWAVRGLARTFPRFVWQVETRSPLVALSFDDGPDPTFTPQVLDLLARHEARATFFLIGDRARIYPSLVTRLRREGHEVANHYLTGRSVLFASAADFERQLLEAERILRLERARPKLFRPPSGLIRPGQLDRAIARGYLPVLGSAYPYDPRRPPAAYMRWLVRGKLRPGAIVVLHDAGGERSGTVRALAGILEDGRRLGLRFVTVGELLATRRAHPVPTAAAALRSWRR
jgi:peptidoglycan/xylan/chitin deacetylase (PgdA/CDA1 family)